MKVIKSIMAILIIVLIIGIVLLTGIIVSINAHNQYEYEKNIVIEDLGDEDKG